MPILTIAVIVVFVGYSLLTNSGKTPENTASPTPEASSEVTATASPAVSPLVTTSPRPASSPKFTPNNAQTLGESQVNISVSTDDNKPTGEQLIYPGANGSSGHYTSDADGEAVYNWYKSEMENRGYHVGNNVKTRANDLFKAVLQGSASTNSLKVAITQENSGAKTEITIE